MKVGIIGCGKVGSAVAFSLLSHVDDIYLYDINRHLLQGELWDLRHASALLNGATVHFGPYRVIGRVKCDVVVICAGKPRTSSKDSMDSLVNYNWPIIKHIGEQLRAYHFKGKIMVVTNPPDKLIPALNGSPGIPVGDVLDNARSNTRIWKSKRRVGGGYILDHKGYTNWGIAAEVVL